MKFRFLSLFIACAMVLGTVTVTGVDEVKYEEPAGTPGTDERLNITGWPKDLGDYVRSCPIIFDIDEDGENEIIQGCYQNPGGGGLTHIWNEDATNVPGWPRSMAGDPSCSTSTIGDVDGDGDWEVVSTTYYAGQIWVWHWNGTMMSGSWPINFGYFIRANPLLADIDGDGDGEIIVTAADPDNIYDGVHCFQHDGTLEWHAFIENCQGPVAAADVDGDGNVEIAVAAWTETFILDYDGTILDSIAGGSHKGAVIGDLTGDGDLEIMGSTPTTVRALEFDGTSISVVWNTATGVSFGGYGQTSCGDLTGDGNLEVFYVNGPNNRLYGYDAAGNPLTGLGFPKDLALGAPSATDPQSAPSIGDIDGDGDKEIMCGSTSNSTGAPGLIFAWHHDGSPVSGYPFDPDPTPTDPETEVICTPTMTDLDSDGDIEIMCGINKVNQFYVWDFNDTYDADNIEWGLFRHDDQCSGLAKQAPTLDHISLPAFAEVGEVVSVSFTAHNPDNMPLRYYVRRMPAGATCNLTTGTFTWTPAPGQQGTYKMYPFLTDGMRQDHLVWNLEVVDSTKFDIPVVDGWNFVSYPIDVSGDADVVLDDSVRGDGATFWDMVQWCDPLTGEWRSYATFRPPALNDLPPLDNTMGLWVHVTALGDGFLTVGSGVVPASTGIQLRAGWNDVGYPSLTSRSITDAFAGTGYDRPVEGFDPGAPYMTAQLADTYMMTAGEAYWVHVPADTVWFVNW